MKKKPTVSKNPPLAAGQLWQMKSGYVQIGRIGKMLVDYQQPKKPGQKAVQIRTGSVANMLVYLKTNRAKLVSNPAAQLKSTL